MARAFWRWASGLCSHRYRHWFLGSARKSSGHVFSVLYLLKLTLAMLLFMLEAWPWTRSKSLPKRQRSGKLIRNWRMKEWLGGNDWSGVVAPSLALGLYVLPMFQQIAVIYQFPNSGPSVLGFCWFSWSGWSSSWVAKKTGILISVWENLSKGDGKNALGLLRHVKLIRPGIAYSMAAWRSDNG